MDNKAQMEILGLALIMILLVLGGLFAIVFLGGTKSNDYSLIQDNQKAISLLSVISLSTSDFGGSFVELIKDCSKSSPMLYYNGISSCEFLQNEIKKLLEDSLSGREYYFTIFGPGNLDQVTTCNSGRVCTACPGERTSQETAIFTTVYATSTLHIELCE